VTGWFSKRAIVCAGLLCATSLARSQQFGDAEKFRLRGRVVNAVTGEPVGGAVVVVYAVGRQAQFSAADGIFEFAGLLRGQYLVEAKKPGYFSGRDLGLLGGGADTNFDVPAAEDAVLKLTPEGVIYGRVEDEKGRPLEGISVQAERWIVSNGTRQLAGQGPWVAQTDDEGNFRVAELLPGEYYLKFSDQGGMGTVFRNAPVRQRAQRTTGAGEGKQGYGTQYYPGVADASTASAIRVRPGAPVPILQSLERLRLYELSGVVRGAPTGSGFGVMLLASQAAGAAVFHGRSHIVPNTGEFRIEKVPPGKYLLRANAQDPAADGANRLPSQLVAQTVIEVGADISGVALVLGHGATIGVQVRDEATNASDQGVHRVRVNLQSTEFPQLMDQIGTPPAPNDPRAPRGFENVAAGTYSVEVSPEGWGYVASVRCAGLDLLREELKVGAGTSVPPIEIRLRNDGAELNVSAVEKGKPVVGRVVVYSEEYPKRSVSREAFPNSMTSLGMLAPGTYKLIATRGVGDQLEYRNPEAMAKYLANAQSLTLAPEAKVNVQVEVQDTEPEQ
jgi:hypothetical protein